MESLAEDLTTMVRRPLTADHVAAIRGIGTERTVAEGEIFLRTGDPSDHFYHVLDGAFQLWDEARGVQIGTNVLAAGQFIGEIAFLTAGRMLYTLRCVSPARVLEVPREAMLRLMAAEPEMSDIIVSVFAARRRAMLERATTAITVVGPAEDRQVRAVLAFCTRNKLPVALHDPASDAAADWGATCSFRPGDGPKVIFGANEVLAACTPQAIAERIGIAFTATDATFDVVIVGGGPAGVSAAVYAGAEGLCALVVEDLAIGGQAGTSSRIENYMGFPTGISGADLCFRGEVQAMKFGTRFAIPHRVTRLEPEGQGWCLTLDNGTRVLARSVVVATGVEYRRMPLDRLEEFEGAGIYYAATEVEARWCRETEVVVIGGGNSAGQAAMFLSRTAKHVHVLVRGGSLAASMSAYLVDRLQRTANITIHYRTQVAALNGEKALQSVVIHSAEDGQDWELNARAVFVMVGAAPNTGWLQGRVAVDGNGFVLTGAEAGADARGRYATSCPGIFAVGDVRAGSVKRVASGVGEGSVVISEVWKHLNP
ncbi:FAD-dependent oxidoreductase [Tabrizicola sp.]|uniref:FAD-dependent oxidoreductase n=1 Tax=Tabrizicola sp. TaxID=2005166 RepID=UPI003F37CBD1